MLVVVVTALAGCSGSPDEDADNPLPSSASSPSSTSGSSALPTEPASSTVPAESERPNDNGGGGNNGGGGGNNNGGGGNNNGGNSNGGGNNGGGNNGGGGATEDKREVEVGGPTLDNTYPLDPFSLNRKDQSSCVVFTNRNGAAAVTVRSVKLVDQQPSKDSGLALGKNPGTHSQCNKGQWPHRTEELRATCTHAVLEPNERTGCPVVVHSVGSVGTDYTGRLLLRLSATCTDLVGQPCARLTGRATPTAARPVTVTWTDERLYTSCLVQREPGSWGEARRGECPPVVEPSDPPSSESEPSEGENARTVEPTTGASDVEG